MPSAPPGAVAFAIDSSLNGHCTVLSVLLTAFVMSDCRFLRDTGCKTATLHVQHLLERKLGLVGNDAQQPVRRRPRQVERVQFFPQADPLVRGAQRRSQERNLLLAICLTLLLLMLGLGATICERARIRDGAVV